MKRLKDLIKENNHRIVRYNEARHGYDYSEKHGGTFDSFKYYNDFYIEMELARCNEELV